MGKLSLSVLGPFEASLDGRPLIHFRTKSVKALLIYLACQPETAHRREHLIALLWPRMPQQSAQANLRQTLFLLRQAIQELDTGTEGESVPFLLADRQTIQVNPESNYEMDLLRFEELLVNGRSSLIEAVELYRGDFLADFFLPDNAAYEAWTLARREVYRRQMLDALEELAGEAILAEEYQTADGYARRQIEIDPLREMAHQQLMEALARNGRRPEALVTFESLVERLKSALGISPSPETELLAKQIQDNSLDVTTKDQSTTETPAELALPRHNLPVDRTPFIGRENELAELERLLADPGTRLITIVGPGGMGKTRLALAAAAKQLHARIDELDEFSPYRYRDGIFFVSLEAVDSAAQIPASINKALGFRPSADEPSGRSPWQQTLELLSSRQLLLIFDNFEQILDGVGYLVTILESAPKIRLLVTSREKLSLHSERLFPLEGLDCPDQVLEGTAVEQFIDTYSAFRLFIQSAKRLRPDFTIAEDDFDDLGRICRLVGGMPLGLELAAGWIELLSITDIVDEIQRKLDVLKTSARDIPERQRSMTAVFESSWLRLDSKDQILLNGLSVFRGGFNREAAQQVTEASLSQLATLVGKSLIHYDRERDRFEIHRLLRQYLAMRLAEDPQKERDVQDRHCTYYCSAIRKWTEGLTSGRQQETLAAMEADSHNMLKAWSWAVARRHIDQMDDASEGLFMYLDLSGNYIE